MRVRIFYLGKQKRINLFSDRRRAEGIVGKLEERYQVSDEEILRSAHGQKCLRAFLQDKDMIYPSGSALDPDRFIRNILAGTTPIPVQRNPSVSKDSIIEKIYYNVLSCKNTT